MQSDAQRRKALRARHRIGGRRARDHQARARQNPVPVRRLYGLVDGNIEAEIIGANDQPLHGQKEQ